MSGLSLTPRYLHIDIIEDLVFRVVAEAYVPHINGQHFRSTLIEFDITEVLDVGLVVHSEQEDTVAQSQCRDLWLPTNVIHW